MYVVIPPDHDKQGVVPICINDVDYQGRLVVPGWIEAVKPIANRLRDMTANITGNVLNVSEVTEEAVHSLSGRHGENLGREPSGRVFISAKWRAQNLRSGGSRGRKGIELQFREFIVEDLEVQQPSFVGAVETRNLIERLRAKARESGRSDLELMIDLYLSDAEDQLPAIFGVTPNSQERNTLTKRLYRGLRTLFESL
jgi:hypothetical protein